MMLPRSVELFAGAGGLGLGVSLAGFRHLAVVEWNEHAVGTLLDNKARGLEPVAHWPILRGDVRELDYAALPGPVALVSGGPPCQPFSIGGKHSGHLDRRDMFPAAVAAVRALRPRAFLFENVRGLARPAFRDYLRYVLSQLRFPAEARRAREAWPAHLRRLEGLAARGAAAGLSYTVAAKVLNAADYGVPQRRARLFIVGFRGDLEIPWRFPGATHSRARLLREQWVTGAYWERHRVARAARPPPLGLGARAQGRLFDEAGAKQPWRTVRDAIADLPEPAAGGAAGGAAGAPMNHDWQPGARAYKGHTGSPVDEPAKALKAGDHGVPGGENMLRRPDGAVRYFTVRESARLQTFPDGFGFCGSWTQNMRQLGNAVPVRLAQTVAAGIARALGRA